MKIDCFGLFCFFYFTYLLQVVEFLSQNFDEERWRAAAVKNAYALVRQRRPELAVAFFLLGGAFSEAMDICCGQMDDPQLALFLALLLEHQELKSTAARDIHQSSPTKESAIGLRAVVLEQKVLPLAVEANDAWLQCLVLWLLGRYEEAVVATLPPAIRPHVARSAQPRQEVNDTNESVVCSNALDRRLIVNLFPDPFQRRTTFIGGTRNIATEASTDGTDRGRMGFCCDAIRYTPLNPTLAMYRRSLLGTVQLRRALRESIVAAEFVDVVKSVCERERIQGGEMCGIQSPAKDPNKSETKLFISAAVVAAVVVLCEEIVNCLDLGEALLFCLSHRLPFQGLQHFTDLRMLLKDISNSERQRIFDISKMLAIEQDMLRVRWNCAVGFSRHACDALGYLTAVTLKESEDDVEWMDTLFNVTVERFGQKTNPLRLAAAAWKAVVDDHGCEHHYQGENFLSWVSRQIEGPVEIRPHLGGQIIELPPATPGPAVPVVDSAVERTQDVSSGEIHLYDEQRHKEAWLVEVFASALRGMPAWSLLSAKQAWTEQIVFRGISTCTLGLIDLLSQARRIGTFGPHSFLTVLAKTLTLQAGVRTAVAWATQSSTSIEARQLLLALSLMATSLISTSATLLILMSLVARTTQPQHEDSNSLTMKQPELSEDAILKSSAWKQWPLHLPSCFLWQSLEQLIVRIDRLETCYIDSLNIQEFGWLETDDGVACSEYICAEILRFLDFVCKSCLMPKPDVFKHPEEHPQEPLQEVVKKVSSPSRESGHLAHGNPSVPRTAQFLAARSEPMQSLLRGKAEAARDVTRRAISCTAQPELKERMRHLLLNVIQLALVDRILGDMGTAEDSTKIILRLYSSKNLPENATMSQIGSTVWNGTVCHTLVAFQSLSTKLRETFHGPVTVEAYGDLISTIATNFPFLPMALTSPLAFSKDTKTLNDESEELVEVDNVCVGFASDSGAADIESRAFHGIWSTLNCSRRLQLIIGRGPILGFPSSLSIATICPDQLPVHSRVIICLKEAPLSISVDKTSDVPFVHHFGSLGPSLSSSHPLGLGVSGFDGVGQNGRSGLGLLSVSTGHGVLESNIAHSVMFHRSFSVTATATGATTASTVIASMTGHTEKSEGLKSHHHHILSHVNLSHVHQIGTHQTTPMMDFDDDPTRHSGVLVSGKLRPYDLAAEVYERQVAEEALIVFNSRLATRKVPDDKKIKELEKSDLISSDAYGRTADDSDANLVNEDRDVTQTIGKRSHRSHWQIRSNKEGRHHRHQNILRRHSSSTATTPLDNQELPLYHYNLLLELLLRGLLGPLADLSAPHFEASAVQSPGGAPARACLLEEESSLVASGLSLFPLPASPQKALLSSSTSNATITARFRTSLDACMMAPGSHRSSVAWIRLIVTLQQRLARNRLVELQLACLPPTPYHGTSHQDHGRAMVLLRPHPILPVCAGVIADSQVVNTSSGTLVISLWKVGEPPNIRDIGWLAMPLTPSTQKGGGVSHSLTETHRLPTASSSAARPSTGEQHTTTASDSKRTGLASTALVTSNIGQPDPPFLGLTYTEAGPIKSLEWDANGERLITGHNKGWIAIWQLRSDHHARVDAAISQKHYPDDLQVHIGELEGRSKLHETKDLHLGLPLLTFKPHLSSCRFAAFLPTLSGPTLIVTSGRGLAPTDLFYHSNGIQKEDAQYGGHHHHSISAGPDEGIVCVWDISPSRVGPPQLLMADTGFEKGSYATHVLVWPARQAILYSGKKGEVRLMNLRNPVNHKWVVHPIGAHQQRRYIKQQQKPDSVLKNEYDPSTGPAPTSIAPVTAGPYGKEIVKMFLLEHSRRLVTCYEDSMV